MLEQSVMKAIDEQIGMEFRSAYLYLAAAGCMEAAGLRGSAGAMRTQASEELSHGMKLFDFVHQRGGRVTLKALEAPHADLYTPLVALAGALKHEQAVTKSINRLYELAAEKKDHATQVFLQWFVTEQVEEEQTALQHVELFKAAEGQPALLLMLDQRMGTAKPA